MDLDIEKLREEVKGIEAEIKSMIGQSGNDADYVDIQNRYIEGNIQIVKTFLADNIPELRLIDPEGTYLLWLDCRDWKLEQKHLLKMFDSWGVRVNDGLIYGKCGYGFVRINVATQKAVLLEALNRIKIGYAAWESGRKSL